MKIYKTKSGLVLESNGNCYAMQESLDELLTHPSLHLYLQEAMKTLTVAGDAGWLARHTLEVPIGSQEVWAAGVTYLRSRNARMEESEESGGATFYDKVYEAERPELFFKSTANRVVPTSAKVRIRRDSTWNVPEPELTLVISSNGEIAGYTIGNDMSSRSIEGENPLYLPQAKVYDGSAAIGPCILVREEVIKPATGIRMRILRGKEVAFDGSTTISQMKRGHDELVEFLYRETSFPNGAFLMTGTCVVPGNEFTLRSGDEVEISIDGIGQLVNTVA